MSRRCHQEGHFRHRDDLKCPYWEGLYRVRSEDQSGETGGMGERLKPAVLKTVSPERGSGVRIPLPPPISATTRRLTRPASAPEMSSRRARHHRENVPSVRGFRLTEEGTAELELATDEALGRVEPPPK